MISEAQIFAQFLCELNWVSFSFLWAILGIHEICSVCLYIDILLGITQDHKQLKVHYDKEVCPRYFTNIEVLDLSHPTETLVIAKFNYHYLFLYHHIALIIIYM